MDPLVSTGTNFFYKKTLDFLLTSMPNGAPHRTCVGYQYESHIGPTWELYNSHNHFGREMKYIYKAKRTAA